MARESVCLVAHASCVEGMQVAMCWETQATHEREMEVLHGVYGLHLNH